MSLGKVIFRYLAFRDAKVILIELLQIVDAVINRF